MSDEVTSTKAESTTTTEAQVMLNETTEAVEVSSEVPPAASPEVPPGVRVNQDDVSLINFPGETSMALSVGQKNLDVLCCI